MMAPDSHNVMSLFGSTMAVIIRIFIRFRYRNYYEMEWVPGTRPLGLMSMNGFFLTSSNRKDTIS